MAPGSGDGVVCDNFTSWKTEQKKKKIPDYFENLRKNFSTSF